MVGAPPQSEQEALEVLGVLSRADVVADATVVLVDADEDGPSGGSGIAGVPRGGRMCGEAAFEPSPGRVGSLAPVVPVVDIRATDCPTASLWRAWEWALVPKTSAVRSAWPASCRGRATPAGPEDAAGVVWSAAVRRAAGR